MPEAATSTRQAAKAIPDAPASRAPGDLSPAEVVGMLDAYALVQAQDSLQLNDSQYGTFVGRLKSLQEIRRKPRSPRLRIIG